MAAYQKGKKPKRTHDGQPDIEGSYRWGSLLVSRLNPAQLGHKVLACVRGYGRYDMLDAPDRFCRFRFGGMIDRDFPITPTQHWA